jgi:hypothetical protein
MGRSEAQVIRQPRDRLTKQPQERQHSAAAGGTRDRLRPASGSIELGVSREGSKPKAETPLARLTRARSVLRARLSVAIASDLIFVRRSARLMRGPGESRSALSVTQVDWE